LINRMTGTAGEAAAPEQPARQQPPVRQMPAAEVDADQEKIEIPAFLRRQAN